MTKSFKQDLARITTSIHDALASAKKNTIECIGTHGVSSGFTKTALTEEAIAQFMVTSLTFDLSHLNEVEFNNETEEETRQWVQEDILTHLRKETLRLATLRFSEENALCLIAITRLIGKLDKLCQRHA